MAGSMTRRDIKFEILDSDRGFRRISWNGFMVACWLQSRFKRWDCKMHLATKGGYSTKKTFEFGVPFMTTWKDALVKDRLADLCNENAQDIIRYTFDALSPR